MKQLFGIMAASVFVIVLATAFIQPDDKVGIVGFNAPKWNVEFWIDGEGKEMTMNQKEYMNKVTFIYCWQHSDSRAHELGFPALQELHATYKDNPDVRFIAVQTVHELPDKNVPSQLTKNQNKYELPFPFGHDAGGEFSETSLMMTDYKFKKTPWVIIVSKDGNVLFNDRYIKPEDAVIIIKKELRGW